MKTLALLSLLLASTATFADDTNPWAERYADNAKIAEALPNQLPEVASAIDTARLHAGIESGLGYNAVSGAIEQALRKEGAGEELKVTLFKYREGKAILNSRSPLSMEIDNVTFNANQKTWSATLYPFDNAKPLAAMVLEGSYDEMIEVPVLTRRFRRDEVITASDIQVKKVESSRIRADTALSMDQMIGLSPRRTLSPDRSIRMAELERPTVIKINDQVTMHYKTDMMELKALGDAMEDGATGDIIRVRNKDSHQPVQGRVLAAGLIEVMPMGVLAQAGGSY